MKILFLTRRFYPDFGGVERHVLEVSKELLVRGNEVFVLTESSPKNKHIKKINYQSIGQSDTHSINSRNGVKSSQIAYFEYENVKIVSINKINEGWFKKIKIWSEIYKKIDLIKDADVVHCQDVFFWYLPFRFLFPKKKIFTTFHGYETKFPPTLKAKTIRKLSELLSNGNICVGDYIKKWYGTKTNFITYGGTDYSIKGVKNTTRQKVKYKIIFLGRIDQDNGVSKYAEILEGLKKSKIAYSFEACGNGAMSNVFKKYGRVNGFVKNVNKHILSSDVVFASSYLSILEALANKKNVVAVYTNNLKKDYLNMSPFKKFITILGPHDDLESGLRFQATNAGYKWARQQTWGKVTDLYIKLWS